MGLDWPALLSYWFWLNEVHTDQNVDMATSLAANALAPLIAEKFRREMEEDEEEE